MLVILFAWKSGRVQFELSLRPVSEVLANNGLRIWRWLQYSTEVLYLVPSFWLLAEFLGASLHANVEDRNEIDGIFTYI